MIDILLAACGGFVCVEMLQVHYLLKWNKKPLNCAVCLSGWFALLIILLPDWFKVPFYMCAAMMVVVLFTSIMKKL